MADETMTSAIAGHQANIFVIHNGDSLGIEDLAFVKEKLGDDLLLRDGEIGVTISPHGSDLEIASSVSILAAQDIPVSDLNPVAMLNDEAQVFRRVRNINNRVKVAEIPREKRKFENTQIIAAPNWQISSTMYIPPAGGGGPGKPRWEAKEPHNSPKFTWKTPPEIIQVEQAVPKNLKFASKPPDVNVFILDALPPKETVKCWQGRAKNHLLTRVLNVATLHWAQENNIEIVPAVQRPGHREDLFSRMGATPLDLPESQWALTLPDEENISDHGVFIAGIIHSIVPRAKLHLIQVLNDAGAGTMRSLTQGLQVMSQIMKSPENANIPAVVNLSLAFCNPEQIIIDAIDNRHTDQISIWAELLGIELSEQDMAVWDKPPSDALVGKLATPANNFFTQTVQPMELIYQLAQAVATPNTIYVAAAGNDGGKSPRYPATSDFVYGVGAVGQDARAGGIVHKTPYSNNPPDNEPVEGSWAFGGDYQDEADKEKGILGISTMTTSGYAWWAGTSFATAGVSGMLARLILTGKNRKETVTFLRTNCKRGDVQDGGKMRGPLVNIFQG